MKRFFNDITRLVIAFIFLVLLAYVAYDIRDGDEIIHIVDAEIVENEVIVYEEKIVPYLITEELPKDYNHRKEMVLMYLRSLGESEEDIATWDRIITQESNYDPTIEPPTFVVHCEGGSIAELTDYGNGVMWQYECAMDNLREIKREKSFGIFQILPSTWELAGCEGAVSKAGNNQPWIAQADCAIKVRSLQGWKAWAAY